MLLWHDPRHRGAYFKIYHGAWSLFPDTRHRIPSPPSSCPTMLGVCARCFSGLRPQIVTTPSRTWTGKGCLRLVGTPACTRTLVTSPCKGAISPPLSLSLSPSQPLLHLRVRLDISRNGVSVGRQLRFQSSTTSSNDTSKVATTTNTTEDSDSERQRPSILSRIFARSPQGISSFRKIVALAKPERKPLLIAIGLLLMSSAVSMSVPFTIGKLIDFFSSPNPVSTFYAYVK